MQHNTSLEIEGIKCFERNIKKYCTKTKKTFSIFFSGAETKKKLG